MYINLFTIEKEALKTVQSKQMDDVWGRKTYRGANMTGKSINKLTIKYFSIIHQRGSRYPFYIYTHTSHMHAPAHTSMPFFVSTNQSELWKMSGFYVYTIPQWHDVIRKSCKKGQPLRWFILDIEENYKPKGPHIENAFANPKFMAEREKSPVGCSFHGFRDKSSTPSFAISVCCERILHIW